jgi:hypothetical protein
MPDFEFTNPDGKRFTVTGPQGAAPEQAWAVLQQHLTGAGSHRDSGPADWGAVPAEPEGPAKWGAVPEQPTAPPGFILDQPKAAKRKRAWACERHRPRVLSWRSDRWWPTE